MRVSFIYERGTMGSLRKEIKDEYVEFLAPFAYMGYRSTLDKGLGKTFEDLSKIEQNAWKSAVRASGRRMLSYMFEEEK